MVTLQDVDPYFIGREDELRQLKGHFLFTLREKRLRLVLVEGDPKSGKTDLTQHFLYQLRAQKYAVNIWQAICQNETTNASYDPFIQILVRIIQSEFHPRLNKARYKKFVTEVIPSWVDLFTGGLVSAMAVTSEFLYDLARPDAGSVIPLNRKYEYAQAIKNECEKKPCVIFIDDFHWADEDSLGLLLHLATNLNHLPILLIVAFRSVEGFVTGKNKAAFKQAYNRLLEQKPNGERIGYLIQVKPEIDLRCYLEKRYAHHSFPENLIKRVEKKSEKHPMFIAQLFSNWQEKGIISRMAQPGGKTTWGITPGREADINIPDSLQKVILDRIKILSTEQQKLLRDASVFGQDFIDKVVVQMELGDPNQGYDNLEKIENDFRLIRRREDQAYDLMSIYEFQHRSIRDCIYDRLPGGQRGELHKKAAMLLENIFMNRKAVAGLIAHHHYYGGNYLVSAGYALKAQRAALDLFLIPEALRWAEFGLTALKKAENDLEEPNAAQRAEIKTVRRDLYLNAGEALYNVDELSKAKAAFLQALQLSKTLAFDCEKLVQCYVWLSDVEECLCHFRAGIKYIDQAKALLEDFPLEPCHATVELVSMEGLLLFRVGQLAQSLEVLQAGLETANQLLQKTDDLGVRKSVIGLHNCLAISLEAAGRMAESDDHFEEAIRQARKCGDHNMLTTGLINLADNHIVESRYEMAERELNQALEVARKDNDRLMQMELLGLIGKVYAESRRPEKALAYIAEALSLITEDCESWYLPFILATQSEAYLEFGKVDQAWESSQAALEKSGEIGKARGYALIAQGKVQLARREYEAAFQTLEEARKGGEKRKELLLMAEAKREMAQLFLKTNRRAEAVGLLKEVLSTYEIYQLPVKIKQVRQILAPYQA